jgi:hypothetical protein
MFIIHKFILKLKELIIKIKNEPIRDYTKGCHNVPSGESEMKRYF